MRFVPLFIAICVLTWAATPSDAGNPAKVVLTIDGKVGGNTVHEFSIDELEALGMQSIETSTPWHDGKIKFEGVPLQHLMEHVGASGKNAAVLALNRYRTEIPLSDFSSYPVILAMKKNGEYMKISDKGPLFVIYPFDEFEELKSEQYYSRSAWQVRNITIE